jgi:hypothetical protein
MGVFGYLLLFVLLAVAAILFLAMQKPDVFRVERRALFNAPPEAIFEHLNSLRKWQGWSPWATKDPAMTSTYAGPEHGVGCAMGWEGNKKVGKGRMEIIESAAPTRVKYRLEFLAPMKNTSTASFTLTPREGGTEVNWLMEGPNLFMGKVMSVFMNMDKMVGDDFEKGLENLRQRVGS